MNTTQILANVLNISEAEALELMAEALKSSGIEQLKAVADNFHKAVSLTAEVLERDNFVKYMKDNYPKVDLTMLAGQFESKIADAHYAGWCSRALFGGLLLPEQTLIEYQRRLFEDDAQRRGYDITWSVAPRSKKGMMPFDEYVSDDTGHRWAGWLARSLNG